MDSTKKNAQTLEKELQFTDEFPGCTYAEWLSQVEAELKGVPFDKKLVTKTLDGLTLRPLYTADSPNPSLREKTYPGFASYLRGSSASGYVSKPWHAAQSVSSTDPSVLNEILHTEIDGGLSAIRISLDTASQKGLDPDFAADEEIGKHGVSLAALADLTKLFKGIDLTRFPLQLAGGFSPFPAAPLLLAYLRQQSIEPSACSVSLGVDPVAFAFRNGTLPVSFSSVFDEIAETIKQFEKQNIPWSVIEITGAPYSDAGASIVQELAYTLSTAFEYMHQLTERGVSAEAAARSIRFAFSISPQTFLEIAKFRAARVIWAHITAAYNVSEAAQKMVIHAFSSSYYATRLDPHVNLLRGTSETFSAIAGGVQSIHTGSFDEPYLDGGAVNADSFARRIARNTQIILREESHLTYPIDPAGGSYFVESITEEIGKAVWQLLRIIENNDGMLAIMKADFVQKAIADVALQRRKLFEERKTVQVGSNMYANVKETPLSVETENKEQVRQQRKEYSREYRRNANTAKTVLKFKSSSSHIEEAVEAFLNEYTVGEVIKAVRPIATQSVRIAPLQKLRLAQPVEDLRARAAAYEKKHGHKPKVFLVPMGALKQHKPRADFSRAYFETGGFEPIYPSGFETVGEAVDALRQSGARVAVLCSSDDMYPELVPAFLQALHRKVPGIFPVLAGFPKEKVDEYKTLGIREFIYLGSNVVETLKKIMNDEL